MKIGEWFSDFRKQVKDTIIFYNVFCWSAIIVSGLGMGYSFVENAVRKLLMDYLVNQWDENNLWTSAAIVNANEGLASVLMIFVAYTADAHLGRFIMVSSCTAAYIVGLVLLCFPGGIVFYVAMVLMAFGKAGQEPPLKALLADQLNKKNQQRMEDSSDSEKKTMEEDEKKVEARTDVWWWVFRSLGAVLALVVSAGSWQTKFIRSACVMGFTFLLFLSGVICYQYHRGQNESNGRSLVVVFRVVKAAISNRHLPMIQKNDGDPVTSWPEIPFTRWIDKAIYTIPTGGEEEETVFTAAQVQEVKELIGMIPMWAIFFLYCIVKATGSTFFVLQFSNLDSSIRGFKVPLIAFFLIQAASRYTIQYLYQLVVQKWWSNAQQLCVMKVKIGLGIWCSFLSCITARLVEARRLSLIEELGYGDYDDQIISMSVFWLTPQFCLLGFMEGLTEDGVVDFVYYKVAGSLKSYGPSFNEFVLGIGKFISVFYVLTFKRWFGHTINGSRLDNYYGILAILSLGNLAIIYGYVSVYFYKDVKGVDKSLHSTMEEVVTQADAAQ